MYLPWIGIAHGQHGEEICEDHKRHIVAKIQYH